MRPRVWLAHTLAAALPAGALATLLEGKLVLVNASTGSPKLDCACSLDLLALAASYSFTTKMKVDAVTLLENLEAWVDKQAISLDLAQNLEKLAQSFDSLLKTMDSLYQVSMSIYLCRRCFVTISCCWHVSSSSCHKPALRLTNHLITGCERMLL
eukprot:GHRQ01028943.1.p1 GENE.GHRQ01028943.1~~GHRQ01028943.1.p1  ORF type:complete len:155 (-),score=29.71 GHRQ01028943.1:487-951(-)